jgi:magnesium transporter
MAEQHWIDLLDPDEAELRRHAPRELQPRAVEELLRRADPDGNTRPQLQGHGEYVFGVLLVAVLDPDRDRLFYQEVDLVITRETVLTVRKTPSGETPFDPARVQEVCAARESVPPGMVACHLVDEIAERYLDLLDDLDGEIDELEENIDVWPSERTRKRLTDLRHDLLRIRRTLAPTRDAVRGVVDGRVDVDRGMLRREVFPEEAERAFAGVFDKLLRAAESLEFLRDLLAAVRDYHQTQIATEQNDVVKKLAAIASLLLFPTFIVGVYGQNFDHMPELHWYLGYAFSWGVIVLTTVVQLAFFRWKRWI